MTTLNFVAPYATNGMLELPWIALARTFLGTTEIKGKQHNPVVLEFWKDINIDWAPTDEIAWCAAFAGAILKRSNLPFLETGLARNYLDYVKHNKKGQVLKQPAYGCLAIMWTGSKTGTTGHIGFVVGEVKGDPSRLLLLGGNQGDKVSIAAFPKSQMLGYIWPNTAPTPARFELPKIAYTGAVTTNTR